MFQIVRLHYVVIISRVEHMVEIPTGPTDTAGIRGSSGNLS